MLKIVCVLVLLADYTVLMGAEPDCSMRYLENYAASSGNIYCAIGYHLCEGHSRACCSDVSANHVELTLVIIGPVSMALSLGALVFVIVYIVKVRQNERQTGFGKNKIAPLQDPQY